MLYDLYSLSFLKYIIYLFFILQEKESSKDLVEASEVTESLGTQLMAIAASSVSSPGLVLKAVDSRNVQLLDSMIEHEQKEVS